MFGSYLQLLLWKNIARKHPTQKPLSVLTRLILASTKPDAWILDPTRYDISWFKKYIRKRNIYNPEPKTFVVAAEEKKAIENENKIRKEQDEPLRKE